MSNTIDLYLSVGQYVLPLPLGDDPPRYSGGNARWTAIERPRRKSITQFGGEDPWTCVLKVMFNAWPRGDVEPLVKLLEDRMHRPDARVEPDLLSLRGPAMAHADLVWVLTEIDDSGMAERRSDGRRCRQELSLTFMEYVSPELIVQQMSPAEAAQARAAG